MPCCCRLQRQVTDHSACRNGNRFPLIAAVAAGQGCRNAIKRVVCILLRCPYHGGNPAFMNLLRPALRLLLASLASSAPVFAQPAQTGVGADEIRSLVERETLQELEQAAIARDATRLE